MIAGWCIEALGYPALFRATAAVFLIAAALSLSLLRMGKEAETGPISTT